jgi:hypothetical protein
VTAPFYVPHLPTPLASVSYSISAASSGGAKDGPIASAGNVYVPGVGGGGQTGLAPAGQKYETRSMQDEVQDLKIRLAQAQSDAKFAASVGGFELRLSETTGQITKAFADINGRLDHIEKSTTGIKTTTVVTGIAAVGLVVAVLGYGQQWFGIGVSTRDIVRSAVADYLAQHQGLPAK